MTHHRTSRFIYLLLLLIPFVLFSPIILTGRAIFWGTPLTQFIPWWTLAWGMIERGISPIWDSMLGMGAPLLANYQTALLYPPTWIYFLLYKIGGVSGMAWGQAVMIVAHLFWAGLGMALLIRQLGLGRLAQIVAGLAFGLSGYMVSRAGFLSINAAASWMPWVILGITKLVDSIPFSLPLEESLGNTDKLKRNLSILAAFILALLALAMQLLAGHAQTTWYTLILAVFWLGFLMFINVRRGIIRKNGIIDNEHANVDGAEQSNAPSVAETANNQGALRYILVVVIFFGIVLIFAAALAAGQLLPTGEYLLQSQRSAAVDYDFAMTYSFWPWRFLTFLTPDLYGNPVSGDYWGYANYWEDAVYIGLIPFVLAVFGLLSWGKHLRKEKYVTSRLIGFLFTIIVIVFLIALGKNTPIFPWLYSNVLTFDMFQAPTRITILALFCLAILAAIGADAWRRPGERGLYWLRLAVMASAAVTIGAAAALLLTRSIDINIRPSFIRSAAMVGILGVGFGVLALKAPRRADDNQGMKWGWWQWAVVLWIGADLLIAGWGLNPGTDLSLYSEPSPTAEEVNSMLAEGRLFLPSAEEYDLKYDRFLRFDTFQPFDEGENWKFLRASLLPNVAIMDEIHSANNFDPLVPGRYSTWMDLLGKVDLESQEQMLNLMGVTVVESIDSKSPYGVRFDSRDTFPRFRWSGCGIQAKSESETLDLIRQNQIDFSDSVILEPEKGETNFVCNRASTADIMVISDQVHKSILSINSSEPGYLVAADVWYPGWQAYVDGMRVPILRANYLFRAVMIPRGQHEVTFEFKSNVFIIGIIISGLSLIGLLSLISYWFIATRKTNNRDDEQ
jgi:hypothetical protein